MSRALVIVGHGSSKNLDTRQPICAAVKTIRETGLFREVRCGLLKQEPFLANALHGLRSDDITIVPYFISQGYYTEQVLPREMKLAGRWTFCDRRAIHYTDPVGVHPRMAELVVDRARAAGARGDETLVVLGHGTPKNPNSATNVYHQAERVASMGVFPQVLTLFIDQEPHLSTLPGLVDQERIVIVPLFVGEGWHVTETIPEDLAGLQTGGREVLYARAVGSDPRIAELILDLAAVRSGDVAE